MSNAMIIRILQFRGNSQQKKGLPGFPQMCCYTPQSNHKLSRRNLLRQIKKETAPNGEEKQDEKNHSDLNLNKKKSLRIGAKQAH